MKIKSVKSAAVRILAILLILSFSFCNLISCGEDKKVPTPESPDISEETKEDDQELFYNELTGQKNLETNLDNQRVLSVMISNYKKSTPQWGISKADIYVEMPVEGGITRIMALFKDWTTLEKIGPVRSARDYYISVALGFNAIYAHFGGSPMAYSKLDDEGIDYIDGIRSGAYFKRDAERRKNAGLEHSAYSTGDMLKNGIDKKKISTVNEKKDISFKFTENEDIFAANKAASAEKAEFIEIPYSNYITPHYEYEASSGLYKRYQFDTEHIDANNNEQIRVQNILILNTSASEISGDEKGRLNVKTIGSGDGVYAASGKMIDIIWKKLGDKSQIELFDTDGNELLLKQGKTFINYVPKYVQKKIIIK